MDIHHLLNWNLLMLQGYQSLLFLFTDCKFLVQFTDGILEIASTLFK